jgi:PIN domain nuclease of toxin-antitoxin system
MSNYVTDTHGLIWYLEDSPRLGPQPENASKLVTVGNPLSMSRQSAWWRSIYLQEKGRIPAEMKRLLDEELMDTILVNF